jgi:two-component system OmpR family sensor kinase
VSLRARLSLAVGILAALLVVSVIAILGLVRTSLVQQIDHQLQTAGRIASGPLLGPLPAHLPTPAGSQFNDIFIEQVAPNGKTSLIARPSSTSAAPKIAVETARSHASNASTSRPFDARSADGSATFRAVAIRTQPNTVVQIALPTHALEATFHRVRLGVLLVTGILFAALALAGWWVERLGIRPIKRVTDAASSIARGDLDHRVELSPASTEAGQLARAFNVMVDARQSSEEQLRQFVADASHELRTPLSTISGVLELHNSGMLQAGQQLDEALRRAAKEATRMSGLVSDLLLLAQLDQGRPLEVREVDLGALVTDAAFDAALLGRDRTVQTDVEPNLGVVANEERLRQVVANLVSNAMSYTAEDGHIWLRVRGNNDVCVLEVSDDGPGMSAVEAAHVFDRFYRADGARSRSIAGAGLGLSIVASIVAAHDGTVSVDSVPRQGTTFRVTLPRRPRPRAFNNP